MKAIHILDKFIQKGYGLIPQKKPTSKQLKSCKLVAHRGAWGNSQNLENTLPAFQLCLDNGVWGIEFDVRWTKDNLPVVHHDPTTERVFKKNLLLNALTFQELRKECPLIPSLQEVLEKFGKKIHLMIELKEKLDPEKNKILKNLLSLLTPCEDYHLMSLQIDDFSVITFMPPTCFIAIGTTNIKEVHQKSLNMELGGVAGHFLLFNKTLQKMQHNIGRQTGIGFPCTRNGLYREIHRKADWIFTNKALLLQKELY